MKEVFRHADSARVGLYQSILEDAEIDTFAANLGTQQSPAMGLLTAICPLPIFFPTLYVLHDEDYAEAMVLLKDIEENASAPTAGEWKCGQCREMVPGNFTSCWNCQTSREKTAP